MHRELVERLATAYNRQDISILKEVLHPELLYSSQWVLQSITSRKEYLDYIEGKFKTITKTKARIFAEIAKYRGRPCIIMAQRTRQQKVCLVLVKVSDGLIAQIDLCQAPHFSSALPLNYYPGLEEDQN